MERKIFLKVLEYYNVISLMLASWNIFFGEKKIITIYSLVMCVVFSIIAINERRNVIKLIFKNKLIIFILIWIGFTSIKSLNTNISLNTLIILAITAIQTILLSNLYSEKSFYCILAKYFVISIIFSYVFIIIYPQMGFMIYEDKLLPVGVYSHKNVLARFMVIATIIFMNDMIKSKNYIKKIVCLVFQILAVTLILLSQSITCIIWIIILVSANIMIVYKNRLFRVYIKIITLYCIIFNIFVYFISDPKISNIISNINIFGKNLSFTGRNSIWNYAITHIQNRFITGYGIDAFWSNSVIRQEFYCKYKFYPPHAHNGYLALLLDGGIVLLVLFIIMLYKSIKNNIDNYDKYNLISILILSFILVVNLTESAFIGNDTYLIWIIICFKYSLTINTKKLLNNKEKNYNAFKY
mgnify:CR=1 FL=1